MPNDPDWLNEIHNVRPLKRTQIFKKSSINKFTNIKLESQRGTPNWQSDLKNGRFSAVIDLHGMTVDNAFEHLGEVITEYYNAQKRVLLVITGKGSIERPSVLKHELPRWLEHGEIAKFILEHKIASQKYGGNGARYIILRKSL